MTTSPKYIVCPDCLGEGSHSPGFTYTQEEIDSEFESREDFMGHVEAIRSGMFNTTCDFCKGARVVTPFYASMFEEEMNYRAEVEYERRMGL